MNPATSPITTSLSPAAAPPARASASASADRNKHDAWTLALGSISGIPIRAHVSWLIALSLATISLTVEMEPHAGPIFAPIVALVTALVLFATLIAHELGHSLVAQRRGVGVRSITLFVFGGIARLEEEPRRPRDEIAIAIAGPLVSVAIGVACLGLAHSNLLSNAVIREPIAWLGRINLGLAAFNMLPGFPLDGGRVLRGVLWWIRKDISRATIGAGHVGRSIAFGLLAIAFARLIYGSMMLDGLWIGLVGWFLLSTANAAMDQARMRLAVGDNPIVDAMRPIERCEKVGASMSLSDFAHNLLTLNGGRAHLVFSNETVTGVATLDGVLSVPHALWPRTTVATIALPVTALPVFEASTPMVDVFARIRENGAPLGLVRQGAHIVGVVDFERLAAIIGIRLNVAMNATAATTTNP